MRASGASMSRDNGKAKDFRKAWKDLLDYMKGYAPIFIIAIVMCIASTVLTLMGPERISEMTDMIKDGITSGHIDLDAISSLGVTLLMIYGFSGAASLIQGYLLAIVTQRLAGHLRGDIARKIDRLPLRFFDNAKSGDIMSRVTNDVDVLGQELNKSVTVMISAVMMLLGTLILMMYTNIIMAVAAIVTVVIGFLTTTYLMKRSQKYFRNQQKSLGAINGHMTETLSAHDIIRSYGNNRESRAKFDELNENLRKSSLNANFISGVMIPTMSFITNLSYILVCVVGAILVINHMATLGTIAAFMIYIRLFTQPLQQISQANASMQAVAAGAERVFEFLGEPEMEDESEKTSRLTDVKGNIEFRDVHFGYLPNKEIIKGLSFEVESGQKAAIVGTTGSGKTTLINLLLRFYETDSGEILIDGTSVKDVPRENIHEQFCVVPQENWLFGGTIRENIVYCRSDVSDDDVREACTTVGLHHFISTLKDGYDTVIGKDLSLSNGQKQQIAIARALVNKAPMLIMDEATSSVDTRTEKLIQEAMDKAAENRTSFIIAHRLSTIRNADVILVMDKGKIAEKGTHEELMQMNGIYADLYRSQFMHV